MQKRKHRECILQSRLSITAFFIINIVFCYFCDASIFFNPSVANAGELYFSTGTHFSKEIPLDNEQKKAIGNYLGQAEMCYKQGKFDEAIMFWKNALSIDPDDPKAKKGIEKAEKKIVKINNFFGKDVFRDLPETDKFSLDDCIRIAQESGLELQVAKEQITLSNIKVWEARRVFLPSLTLSWSETKGIQSGGKTEGLEYGIEGKQPAFHSGELAYKLAQAKANLKIAEKNYDKVKSDLNFEVAKVYYQFVKAEKSLEYIKALYEEAKPLYEMARKKHEKAIVSEIEHLNAESKMNRLYYKSIAVESDFELAKLALEQKLNLEDGESIDVKTELLPKDVEENVTECLSLAIVNRPDLKMSELTVKSTEYGKRIAQSKEMPQVDLAGHYKRSSEVYKQGFGGNREASLDPRRKWYAGLEVAWPFLGSTGSYSLYKREDPDTLSTFSAGTAGTESKGTTWKLGILDNMKQFTETQEAEITRLRAQEELDDTRKKVVMEVKEAFYGYEKARIQLEAAKVQKEFQEKEFKILKVKHSLGEAELSELFNALVNLMEGSEVYFDAERGLYTSIAALNRAIGIEGYF